MPLIGNIPTEQLAIIVLAAGESSRLGQPKQLVKIHGQSLLQRQCHLALEITDNVFCVLGFQADHLRKELSNLPVSVVTNDDWQQGMSSSIAAGVKALPVNIQAVMIILVDQWQLTHTLINSLVDKWIVSPKSIILTEKVVNTDTQNNKKFGPPTIFPKSLFSQLTKLTGEQGAKSILIKNQELIISINMEKAFIDLDTPEQLAMMQKNEKICLNKIKAAI